MSSHYMNLIIAIALFEKNDLCIGLQLQIVFWYLYIYLFIDFQHIQYMKYNRDNEWEVR